MKPFNAIRPVIFINPICLPKLPYYYPLWKRHIEYPKYQIGDPQIKMYLCPFWMKIIRPVRPIPKHHVTFKVHPQMTEMDIKQYLKKLYNVDALHVKTNSISNDLEPLELRDDTIRTHMLSHSPYSVKPSPERYEKIATVHLSPDESFEFPDLFATKDIDEKKDAEKPEEPKKEEVTSDKKDPRRGPGLPTWFG